MICCAFPKAKFCHFVSFTSGSLKSVVFLLLKLTSVTNKKMSLLLEMFKFQIVADQQNTLSRAGVPNFRVTKNENEIVLQMEIIRFITTVINKHL